MNILKKIENLLSILPEKDNKIANQYLKNRDFENVLEIVESDLYKEEKRRLKNNIDEPDDYIMNLTELKGELLNYMSYLDIPESSNDYDY